MHLIQW